MEGLTAPLYLEKMEDEQQESVKHVVVDYPEDDSNPPEQE